MNDLASAVSTRGAAPAAFRGGRRDRLSPWPLVSGSQAGRRRKALSKSRCRRNRTVVAASGLAGAPVQPANEQAVAAAKQAPDRGMVRGSCSKRVLCRVFQVPARPVPRGVAVAPDAWRPDQSTPCTLRCRRSPPLPRVMCMRRSAPPGRWAARSRSGREVMRRFPRKRQRRSYAEEPGGASGIGCGWCSSLGVA